MRCMVRVIAVVINIAASVFVVATPRACFGEVAASGLAVAAVDRSSAAAGLKTLIEAIERSDVPEVEKSISFPAARRLMWPDAAKRAYAECLTMSSQLEWLIDEKEGGYVWAQISGEGGLGFIRHVDAQKVQWRREGVHRGELDAVQGVYTVATKDGKGATAPVARMVQTEDGWKVDQNRILGQLLRLEGQDIPWRDALVKRVLEDVRSGKLRTSKEVIAALQLHTPARDRALIKPDRSTPEGAVAAFIAALESGEVEVVADSMVMEGGDPPDAYKRAYAERLIGQRKLEKAIREKFGEAQADRVAKERGLRNYLVERYAEPAGWVVDGDVARAAFDPPRVYEPAACLDRVKGVWRLRANAGPGNSERAVQNMKAFSLLERRVLGKMDSYKTSGDVYEALNPEFALRSETERKEDAEADSRNAATELKRETARQPANREEAFEQQMGLSLRAIGVALKERKPEEAAKYFYVAGDENGVYAQARERRRLATDDLITVAAKEVDSGAASIAGQFGLVNFADDGYGLAMARWKLDGDRAIGRKPEGISQPMWVPEMRKIGGVWKIDVTPELLGTPKDEAQRAEEEAKKLDEITAQVKAGKYLKIEELREVMRKAGIRGNPQPEVGQ
jgi:hypothetical protein